MAGDEYKVAVAMPERYTTAKDMKSWLERAVEGETDVDFYGNSLEK